MVTTESSQIITLGIFVVSYILIFSGKIHRTVASLFGLIMVVAAGYAFHFLTFESVLEYVDWNVILLLFGMMTYVGLMAKTGFFRYLGIKAIKLAKGEPWLIFLYLSLITTFVSMVVDNVTTILLVLPLTVEVSELLEINPIPILLGEAILSNIGGVATLVGDPPNIMIASRSGYNFNDFIAHLFLPVMVSLLFSIIAAKLVYRRWIEKRPKNVEKLLKIDPRIYIEDETKMRYYLYIMFAMITLFVTEPLTGIPPPYVALAGGVISLLISRDEPREAFKAVEWPTLMFFVALFALVGSLEEVGLLDMLAEGIASTTNNVLLLSVIILWVTGITSAFVDNIPITAAMLPVVESLATKFHTGLFWWALAMGVGMGGNITPIGSSAGVITVSLSRRFGYEIRNRDWLLYGTLTGIISMAVCSVFLLVLQYY